MAGVWDGDFKAAARLTPVALCLTGGSVVVGVVCGLEGVVVVVVVAGGAGGGGGGGAVFAVEPPPTALA